MKKKEYDFVKSEMRMANFIGVLAIVIMVFQFIGLYFFGEAPF